MHATNGDSTSAPPGHFLEPILTSNAVPEASRLMLTGVITVVASFARRGRRFGAVKESYRILDASLRQPVGSRS